MEAIYNLGLASVRLGELGYGVAAFKKLHAMLPENPEARGRGGGAGLEGEEEGFGGAG